MFQCARCDKLFSKEKYFRQHQSKRKIPCDLHCLLCNVKYATLYKYKHHTCTPQPINNNQHINDDANGADDTNEDKVDEVGATGATLDTLDGKISFNLYNVDIPGSLIVGKDLTQMAEYFANPLKEYITEHPDGKYNNQEINAIVVESLKQLNNRPNPYKPPHNPLYNF